MVSQICIQVRVPYGSQVRVPYSSQVQVPKYIFEEEGARITFERKQEVINQCILKVVVVSDGISTFKRNDL